MKPGQASGRALWFEHAFKAAVRSEGVRDPGPGEVTVKALVSLISMGTEMNAYRGQIPADTPLPNETAAGSFGFPLKYAYQVMGEVVAAGSGVGLAVGARVFARHPHQSLFTLPYVPHLVVPIPDELSSDQAVFANLAGVGLNALLDVPPRIGDVVAVFGQGIVGSLITQLAQRAGAVVIAVDPSESRRDRVKGFGAVRAVHPQELQSTVRAITGTRGLDIAYEASGSRSALQQAVDNVGLEGTIAAVSFYGNREVTLRLSPEFHFRRQKIISSHVGNIPAEIAPRWDAARRMSVVLDLLPFLFHDEMITHRIPFESAPDAYEAIEKDGDSHFGVVLDY